MTISIVNGLNNTPNKIRNIILNIGNLNNRNKVAKVMINSFIKATLASMI